MDTTRKTLLSTGCLLGCLVGFWTPVMVWAESGAVTNEPSGLNAVGAAQTVVLNDQTLGEFVPLPEITTIMEHRSGQVATRGVTPGPDDILTYSNSLGDTVFRPFPVGIKVADDIVTDAVAACNITSFKIRVNGGISGGDGEFSVSMKVWDGCPDLQTSSIIVGRTGTGPEDFVGADLTFAGLEDDETIVHDLFLPASTLPIELPPIIWVQVSFSTRRSGWVFGSPSTVGFSGDLYDHTFTGCNTWLGGSPPFPQASGYAEIWADPTCTTHFLAYRAASPSAPTFVPPLGAASRIADDLFLIVDDCILSAYELGMRGIAGPYEMSMDLRVQPEGNPIDGTENVFEGKGEGSIEVTRFTVPSDVNITIPGQVWMTWQANKPSTGVLNVGRPQAGSSNPDFAGTNFEGNPGWTRNLTISNRDAIFHVTIYCRGEAPRGACCPAQDPGALEIDCIEDVTVLFCSSPAPECVRNIDCPDARWAKDRCCGDTCCEGGDNNNRTCCAAGGNCRPEWVDEFECIAGGGSCVASGTPPAFDPPCGAHSCCQPGEGGRQCDNLFFGECEAITDPTEDNRPCESDRDCPGTRLCLGNGFCAPKHSRWFTGEFCGQFQFGCPFFACFDGEGDCFAADDETVCQVDSDCPGFRKCEGPPSNICEERTGCANLACCDRLCGIADDFCCSVAWDSICVGGANEVCLDIEPGNDFCFDSRRPSLGAIEISLNDSGFGFAVGNNSQATIDKPVPEPGFCCHNGGVDRKALGSMWYWFEAQHTSARIHTCSSPGGGAGDTLLQVFGVDHPDQGRCVDGSICSMSGQDCTDGTTCVFDKQDACDTLPFNVIGCNDDAGGSCGEDGKGSSVCASGLTIGARYYVLLGAASGLDTGTFELRVQSPCAVLPPNDNFCVTPSDVIQAVEPFDLGDATLDCPASSCVPTMKNDIWKVYVAACTGQLTAHTCEGTAAASPPTTLVVYQVPFGSTPITICASPNREVSFPDGLLVGCNDDADFDRVCSLSGDACATLNDCKGKRCTVGGELCHTDADCAEGICATFGGAQAERACSVSGKACQSLADCTVGLCEDDLFTTCDSAGANTCPFRRCAIGGQFCQSDAGCTDPGDSCERWECLAQETCDDAECTSSTCGRSAFVTAPVFSGRQYVIRVGGEFGEEFTGNLTLSCEEIDCNGNGGPDEFDILAEISMDCNGNKIPDECEILRGSVPGTATFCDVDCLVDCNANGTLDVCEIDQGSSAAHCSDGTACNIGGSPCTDGTACVGGLGSYFCSGAAFGLCDPDTNSNGIPDDCESGPGCTTLVADSPLNCAIDARQPSTIDGVTVQGWESMDVTVGPSGCELALGDLAAPSSIPTGPNATISSVTQVGDVATITFGSIIPLRNWTCVSLAADATQQVCLGNLPGDVNSDGTSNPALDLGALIDCINNPGSCTAWQENTDRTGGAAGVLDITRVIDLFNGAGSYASFTGASFSGNSCPSAP